MKTEHGVAVGIILVAGLIVLTSYGALTTGANRPTGYATDIYQMEIVTIPATTGPMKHSEFVVVAVLNTSTGQVEIDLWQELRGKITKRPKLNRDRRK